MCLEGRSGNVAEANRIDKKSPFPRWTPYRRRGLSRLPEKFGDFVVHAVLHPAMKEIIQRVTDGHWIDHGRVIA